MGKGLAATVPRPCAAPGPPDSLEVTLSIAESPKAATRGVATQVELPAHGGTLGYVSAALGLGMGEVQPGS